MGPRRPDLSRAFNKLVKEAVADAVVSHDMEFEAERERQRQARVEDRTSKMSKDAAVKPQDEADDEPLAHRSASTRPPAPPPDTTVKNPGEPPAPQAQQPPAGAQSNKITSTSIIDKFNIIRSGRSMSDRDIADAMERYLDSLPDVERRTTLSVLQGIGRIVAPNVDVGRMEKPPEKAEPPGQQSARLAMLQRHREDAQAPRDQPRQRPAPEEDEEDEDRSPPIRVGGRTSESVRAKMKLMLK